MYPVFEVPGVRPEDIWQLFNVSNYEYYRQKVEDLRNGVCPFCTINPAVNKVLYENLSWRVWKNEMAPRSGQECQLVIPHKSHITLLSQLMPEDLADLAEMLTWARDTLHVSDHGVLVIRSGDPLRNAKSVPHLHVNFHYPTGRDRVEITIAKSCFDLEHKRVILMAWERYRIAEERGDKNPTDAVTAEEWKLIKYRMAPLEKDSE